MTKYRQCNGSDPKRCKITQSTPVVAKTRRRGGGGEEDLVSAIERGSGRVGGQLPRY